MMNSKSLHTYMSNAPSEADIKETCKLLGLKITGSSEKNQKVVLKPVNDNKLHLSLGFYTNSICQNFFDESIIAHCIHLHYL